MRPADARFWANTWTAWRTSIFADLMPKTAESAALELPEFVRQSRVVTHPAMQTFFDCVEPRASEYLIHIDTESGANPEFFVTNERLIVRNKREERYEQFALTDIARFSDSPTRSGATFRVVLKSGEDRALDGLKWLPRDAVLRRAMERASDAGGWVGLPEHTTLTPLGDSILNQEINYWRAPARLSADAGTGDLFAFHGMILFCGGLFVLPFVYTVIARNDIGELGNALYELSYLQLVGLSLAMLLPTVAAFGMELRFSLLRFLIAAGFVALYVYGSALRAGQSYVLVPIGGGILGFVTAWGLGAAGLALRRRL